MGGEELSKNDTPRWHRGLTLLKGQTIRTLLPRRSGERRDRRAWIGVRHEVRWAKKEQGAPGTFWAPEKAW